MGGAGASDSSGEGRNAWEAVSIVLRIATVGMSLATAVTTFASTQCVFRDDGSAGSSVSYSDYGSFKYSALANVLSAFLQGVAIWLEVVGKEKWSKTVELIDKVVLALTSTSGPLLLAADDITSCGPPRGRRGRNNNNNNGARQQATKLFVGKLQLVAFLSLGPLIPVAANEVVKKLKQHEEVRSAADHSAPDDDDDDDDSGSLVLVLPSASAIVPPAPVPPPPPSPSPPPSPPPPSPPPRPPVLVLPPPPPPPPRQPMVILMPVECPRDEPPPCTVM